MKSRISGHDHLSEECYDRVEKVEYIELSNHSEGAIYEVYLINKHSPEYNKVDKRGDVIGFELPEKEWVSCDKAFKSKTKINKPLPNFKTYNDRVVNKNIKLIKNSVLIDVDDFILFIDNLENYKIDSTFLYYINVCR